jgi:hypothetical protein
MEKWVKHIKRKKLVIKDHTLLYHSIYTKCPEWKDPQRQKVDSWFPGGKGQGNGAWLLMGTESFRSDKNALKVIVY